MSRDLGVDSLIITDNYREATIKDSRLGGGGGKDPALPTLLESIFYLNTAVSVEGI